MAAAQQLWSALSVVALALASLASAEIPFTTVGRCRYDTLTNALNFNIDQYVRGFAGRWDFHAVAATPDNAALVWAYLRNAAGDDGLFYTQIFGQQEGEDMKQRLTETLSVDANGVVSATPVGTSTTIKLAFMCYEPGKFAYYYACRDDSDYEMDTRFIITYEGYQLDQNDQANVWRSDGQHRFRGGLRRLSSH